MGEGTLGCLQPFCAQARVGLAAFDPNPREYGVPLRVPIWAFPKIKNTYFGALTIRILLFKVLC